MNTLTLYKYSELTPSRNAWVDDVEWYLERIPQVVIRDFQKLRVDNDIQVKVNLSQDEIDKGEYNYARYQTEIEGPRGTTETVTYYFFITDMEQVAEKTIRLTLSIDSITTFGNRLIWNEKTKIIREHRDRFFEDMMQEGKHLRRIDRQDEGLNNISKELIRDQIIEDEEAVNTTWHLMYDTINAGTPEKPEPIACYLVPEEPIKVAGAVSTDGLVWDENDLIEGTYYYFTVWDNQHGSVKATWNGHADYKESLGSKTISGSYLNVITLQKKDGIIWIHEEYFDNTNKWEYSGGTNHSASVLNHLYINNVASYRTSTTRKKTYAEIQALPQTTVGGGVLSTFDQIDRTKPTWISSIALPYCPVEVKKENDLLSSDYLEVITRDNRNYWKIKDINLLNRAFVKIIRGKGISTDPLVAEVPEHNYSDLPRNDFWESKLLNSAFTENKLSYDNDSITFNWENFDFTTFVTGRELTPFFYTEFKASSAIQSSFLFKLLVPERGWGKYRKTIDYPNILISNRNNQDMLYNTAYLNYIRTGYNYDRNDADRQLASGWINTAISGGVGAFNAFNALRGSGEGGLGGVVSLATVTQIGNTATGLVNQIFNHISTEEALSRKIAESKAQSANISGNSDFDFMNYYSGNKLHYRLYQPRPELNKAIADLFFYCGYSHPVQKIPNLNSRRHFNFIQCQPVFDNENSEILTKYIDDIKARFEKGVTVYHKYNNNYDWDQVKENWESWV